MSLKVLHLADLHLGAPFRWMRDRSDDRRKDLTAALIRAVDYAIDRVDMVIFAGDTFDSHHPADALVYEFRGQMSRLDHAGIPVVVVPGNHDAYYYPDSVWRIQKFPGVTLINTPEIEEPVTLDINHTPVHIYGMAYQPTLSRGPFDEFRRKDTTGVHIAVIHGSLMHAPQWGVHSRDCPLDPEKLQATGMDYIALGHYHRFSETTEQGIPIVYPGTLEGVTLQETGERYLVTATFDNDGVQIQKQQFQSRMIHEEVELDVTGWEESGTEQVLGHVLKLINNPDDIYQIKVSGSSSGTIDFAAIQATASEKCFFLKLEDETSLLESETIGRIAGESTVRGAFVRAVLERKQQPDMDDRVAEMALRYGLELFIQEDTGSDANP